ncbi:hypothetical protein BSL78_20580 [Apostichopus japonicus]|uniref:Uncharacterized protein n=1 Tax=Stichopus japonicus TaxID=307972 RepID=A0A2G8K3L6_STIJA|nr:hypothetical protein BSL78_20580 [Apostichopus japonicus]
MIRSGSDAAVALKVSKTGSYEISVDDVTWFESHDTYFTINGVTYSLMAGTLNLVEGPTLSKQWSSRLGPMQQISLTWQASDKMKTRIITAFQLFEENPAIVFTQNFSLAGLSNSSVGNANHLCTSFPSFTVSSGVRKHLGYLSFDQLFMRVQTVASWDLPVKHISNDLYSAPLTIFNETKYTMVLSSFKEFMVSSMFYDGKSDAVQQGIMGMITEIPKGFIQQSVMQFGAGIKETVLQWGKMLRKQYNTKRYTDNDLTLKYIGYWTDAGAFYYYNTETNITYEKTLIDVKDEAEKNYIPYKYYQIDSWWYYRGLISSGVKNWTAMPSVFPHNSSYVYKNLGYPIAAHNKYWDPATDYAKKNGGAFDFIVEFIRAIPQDEEFWNFLLSSAKKEWGLILYEQDWLNHQFEDMSCTLENVTVARKWLMDMGKGAMRNGLPIQYCMPMARHLLQTVEIPHVTQARASDDYHPGNDQWKIGLTSIIHHALDIRPFKDNFRTNPANDHSPKYQPEPYPGLQTVIAIYSTGPVGPSDRIGFENVTRINRTINSDGLLLQPSRPMMAADDYILGTAFAGKGLGVSERVWSTYSNVSGFIFGAIMAIDVAKPIQVTPENVELEMTGTSYTYMDEAPVFSTKLFDKDHPLTVGPNPEEHYQLWHTAPIFKFNNESWAILGETSKLVPVSPNRFNTITVASEGIHLELHTGAREVIKMMVQTGDTTWELECAGLEAGGRLVIKIKNINVFACVT